jgi:hypothetical protein
MSSEFATEPHCATWTIARVIGFFGDAAHAQTEMRSLPFGLRNQTVLDAEAAIRTSVYPFGPTFVSRRDSDDAAIIPLQKLI